MYKIDYWSYNSDSEALGHTVVFFTNKDFKQKYKKLKTLKHITKIKVKKLLRK